MTEFVCWSVMLHFQVKYWFELGEAGYVEWWKEKFTLVFHFPFNQVSKSSGPDAHVFSHSSVMMYSSHGDQGKPLCYQATSSTRQAPGQVSLLPWTKKRTIPEIRGKKNTVRSYDIMLDHERSAQGKVNCDCPQLLPCADRTWSSMITHNRVAIFSSQISGMVLFFFFVQVKLYRLATLSQWHGYFWIWHKFVEKEHD